MPRSSASSTGAGAGVRNAGSQLSSALGNVPSSAGRVGAMRRSETPLFFPAYV
jgi:hypothetical protein